MKRLTTLGLLAMLALGAAACGDSGREVTDIAQDAPTVSSVTAVPDDPMVRLAGMTAEDGSLIIAVQWRASNTGEWQRRVVLDKVAGERIDAGGCFVTKGEPIGRNKTSIRGHACTTISGAINIYISGQYQYGRLGWSNKRFLGRILSEQREMVGTWVGVGTNLGLTTAKVAFQESQPRTRPATRTRSAAERSTTCANHLLRSIQLASKARAMRLDADRSLAAGRRDEYWYRIGKAQEYEAGVRVAQHDYNACR